MKKQVTIFCLILIIGTFSLLLWKGDGDGFPAKPGEPRGQIEAGLENGTESGAIGSDKEEAFSTASATEESGVRTEQLSEREPTIRDEKDVIRAATGGYLGSRMSPLPRGSAALTLEDREVSPSNFSGHYQRVLMKAETSAKIVLQWPGVGAERPVFVNVIHGGRINGKSGMTLQTNSRGQIVFDFETNANPGRYEVLVRSGPSEEVLHFWVPTGEAGVDLYGI